MYLAIQWLASTPYAVAISVAEHVSHPRRRVCAAMPPKHDSGNWRPVQITSELTIAGGKTTKSYVLAIDTMPFEDADIKLVQVSSADVWLCEMVTGQVCSRRPLSRSRLFKLLKNLVTPAVAGDIDDDPVATDKIEDLAFDGDEDSLPTVGSAEKNRRLRGSHKYKGAVVKRIDVLVNPCAVPAGEPGHQTAEILNHSMPTMGTRSEPSRWRLDWFGRGCDGRLG